MSHPLQALLGIQFPIIQAPMAGAQGSALALAVTQSGGLGSLPAATISLEALRTELQVLQAQATGAYNVNFFCHRPRPPPWPRGLPSPPKLPSCWRPFARLW